MNMGRSEIGYVWIHRFEQHRDTCLRRQRQTQTDLDSAFLHTFAHTHYTRVLEHGLGVR